MPGQCDGIRPTTPEATGGETTIGRDRDVPPPPARLRLLPTPPATPDEAPRGGRPAGPRPRLRLVGPSPAAGATASAVDVEQPGDREIPYRGLIQRLVPAQDALHVEAWLTVVHPDLDGIDPVAFANEVRVAAERAHDAGPGPSETLARLLGILS